jgi:hypothetical protein
LLIAFFFLGRGVGALRHCEWSSYDAGKLAVRIPARAEKTLLDAEGWDDTGHNARPSNQERKC